MNEIKIIKKKIMKYKSKNIFSSYYQNIIKVKYINNMVYLDQNKQYLH